MSSVGASHVACLRLFSNLCCPRKARNAFDWKCVPVLIEGTDGGFATSEEFLCHV
jgi:hypothetical protein